MEFDLEEEKKRYLEGIEDCFVRLSTASLERIEKLFEKRLI